MLLRVLDGTPWKLPLCQDLLRQAQGTLFHALPQGFNLWTWPLRGLVYRHGAYKIGGSDPAECSSPIDKGGILLSLGAVLVMVRH